MKRREQLVWKSIEVMPGYMVSCYGDVLSLLEREPRVLRQSNDSKGYKVVNLNGKVRRVHRLVASSFLGLDFVDVKTHVLHRDDDPTNNNVANLSLGSHLDNMHDMRAKGRHFSPPPKITDSDVSLIRRRLANGERGYHLASEYGVSPSLISQIKNGSRRSNVA